MLSDQSVCHWLLANQCARTGGEAGGSVRCRWATRTGWRATSGTKADAVRPSRSVRSGLGADDAQRAGAGPEMGIDHPGVAQQDVQGAVGPEGEVDGAG